MDNYSVHPVAVSCKFEKMVEKLRDRDKGSDEASVRTGKHFGLMRANALLI